MRNNCLRHKFPFAIYDMPVGTDLEFDSQTSLVQRSNQKAYKELKKGLFGEDSASKPEIKEKSEDGAFLKEFWKCKR